MILFSVIVPVYNVEAYLPQCIESILNQTYTNFELILVDDGSPDNCGKICDDYASKDSRIRVVHKENGGLVSARRAGAELATGAYVCCVDGDDWLSPDSIQKIADDAAKYNSDIICFGMILSFSNKQIERPICFPCGFYDKRAIEERIFPNLIQNDKAGYFPPTLCGKAIKRVIYLPIQLSVDARIKIGEDGACSIPCIYNARSLSILSDCLYIYRQNEESMTKERKAFSWLGPQLIAEQIERHIDCTKFDFQQQLYRKTAHELFTVVVSQFNRDEAYRKIKHEILQNLETPIYQEAINKAEFSDIRGIVMTFALKLEILWLIWLWNRLR